MNREIKFRAWDGKKMWHGVETSYDYLHIDDEAYRSPIDFTNFGEVISSCSDECSLMQYTGLKDCKGVEIYEGDILQAHTVRVVVLYQAPAFVMKQKILKGYSKTWTTFIFPPEQLQFEEIIGNVHENPELLEAP